ncbi:nuclear transport factor 2 family protein [Tahibacter soli]|uniref:Nuclear transport factor 2 family protein n=1 Tax=Tahibacter soli TaxID=2983605 RepID=A0A9X3YHF3_9GAMM|nr:nuclear transport factor 2 family protein [Tahibacter soli]MDC8012459.1 nuclear transport factor 2 family protein [Tahibacter soli]
MTTLTTDDFRALLARLATLWAARDYATLVRLFSPDVRYADPLRYRLDGRDALLAFFQNDDGLPQRTQWHAAVFDAATQTGAAEYTYDGTHRYHGVALVRLRDGLITHWREYQHVDAREWRDYVGATFFD